MYLFVCVFTCNVFWHTNIWLPVSLFGLHVNREFSVFLLFALLISETRKCEYVEHTMSAVVRRDVGGCMIGVSKLGFFLRGFWGLTTWPAWWRARRAASPSWHRDRTPPRTARDYLRTSSGVEGWNWQRLRLISFRSLPHRCKPGINYRFLQDSEGIFRMWLSLGCFF